MLSVILCTTESQTSRARPNEKYCHETESVTSDCVENCRRQRKSRCRVSVSRARRFRGETRLRRFSFIRIINVSGCITPAKCFYYSRVREIPVYAAKLSPRVCIRDPHSATASIAPQPTSCRLPFVLRQRGGNWRKRFSGDTKVDGVVKCWVTRCYNVRINENEFKSKNFSVRGNSNLSISEKIN